MICILSGIFGAIALTFYILLAASKTEEERWEEDEAQMKYIRWWKEEYRK